MQKGKRSSSTHSKKSKSPPVGLTETQVDALIALTWKLGEPLSTAEGMELVHVECRAESRGRVLRLFIDKPGGVKLADCGNISRQIGDLLDVHMNTESAYLLEVSSPGPDRPLGKADDYNRFKGHRARIETVGTINQQHNFMGTLAGVDNEIVTLKMEDHSITIPLSQIKHASLIEYQGEN